MNTGVFITKKIAGRTGSVLAIVFGMILVLVTLVSSESLSFPPLHFALSESETASLSAPSGTEEMPNAEEGGAPARLSMPTELESDPEKISGLNAASFSASLYGAAAEHTQEPRKRTLSSLVLAQYLPERDLGTFAITYQVTPEEYEMLLYCVNTETRNGSLTHRILITQVIMNRVQGQRFPFTVAEVLNAPNQFDVMPFFAERGEEWEPLDLTRQAVDLVLSGAAPDYAQGALYFCNPYLVGEGNWFDTALQTVCELEGHRFYK